MDFKSYLKKEELSKTTVDMYYYIVMDFIVFLDKDQTATENCTEKEIMLYLSYLQKKGVDEATKKLRLYALKHFFNYELELGKRSDNPAKRIKLVSGQKQKLYPVLSYTELQNLYENYLVPNKDHDKSHHNWFTSYRLSKERNKAILGLLVNQGLTTSEIGRIQIDDLDLRKGAIEVRGARIGKDRTLELKSNQIIDLMEYLYTTRKELLEYQSTPSKQLFLSTPASGKTKVETTSFDIWKRLTQELKVQNTKFINIQQIRLSVIVGWLKKYNLREVQYKAGHKSIKSTEMYLINDIDDLQKEIESFHPIG